MPTIGVAVPIPEPWATQLQDYRTGVGDATATSIPTHITLVPPTEVEQADLAEIDKHLASAAGDLAPFPVHLRGTGTFRPVSPVVFVSLAEGVAECERLADACRRGPLDIDLAFPYHPHVTVAHHLAEERLDQALSELADFECEFDVADFHLYVHDEQHGWRATRYFALNRGYIDRMPAVVDRVKGDVSELRSRRPSVDHVIRMQEQYGKVNASQQAGAATYFGFLSVFPVLALAFFVVGYVAKVYPDAQDTLISAIKSLFPGLISTAPSSGASDGKLHLADITDNANTAGIIGVLGVVYSGLGWMSALRSALIVVFEMPDREKPNFLVGKARDLATLAIIGFVLLFAVAFTGFVSGFSQSLLGYVGLSASLGWLVQILTILLGLLANAVLFFAMFWLLANPDDVPNRSLWSGALLGAVGFEILKQLSTLLIKSTQGQPAFQVFGLALILVVWINYFSRVVLYAAAWAFTSPASRAARVSDPAAPVQGPQVPTLAELADVHAADSSSRAKPFLVGAALGVVAAVAAVGGRSD